MKTIKNYPRPQFVRDSWLSLNGKWKFVFDDENVGEEKQFFNKFPSDLQNVIAKTKVISGHGNTSGETNFISTDKIYLLSAHEIWEDATSNRVSSSDTAYKNTRQLDYYKIKEVTTNKYLNTIKQYNGSNSDWWLRSGSSGSKNYFLIVKNDGDWTNFDARYANGFAPAFRIG